VDKKPLIVVSICAVVLLVMASLTNVVGYQTIQTSQQNLLKERINQRELAFQTIVDIANNKEIQRIILKYQMSKGVFPPSDIPVITKQQIRQMYFIGLILSKVISKSRMQSMIQKNQLSNPEMQKELSTVIEKDATISNELTQLQNSECDCENENAIGWNFTIVCFILLPIKTMAWYIHYLYLTFPVPFPFVFLYWVITWIIVIIIDYIGILLDCFWAPLHDPHHNVISVLYYKR
jgi:hypothetical protein